MGEKGGGKRMRMGRRSLDGNGGVSDKGVPPGTVRHRMYRSSREKETRNAVGTAPKDWEYMEKCTGICVSWSCAKCLRGNIHSPLCFSSVVPVVQAVPETSMRLGDNMRGSKVLYRDA